MVGFTKRPSITVMGLISDPVHFSVTFIVSLVLLNVRRVPNTLGAAYSLFHIQRKKEYANEREQTDRHVSGKLF